MDAVDEVRDRSMTVADGRTVAWTESGVRDGWPLLRVPGTPGSRWSLRADRSPWVERGLRVVTTERPGFGASSRLPGRRFAEHADDLAAILDHLDIERVHVIGGSGSTPHLLCFCVRHPDRVVAATNVVGTAPLEPDEVGQMIGLNAAVVPRAAEGDHDGVTELLTPARESILADPLAAFRDIMATAPPSDRAVMADPLWQQGFARGVTEALAAGVGGWVDECLAISQAWDDVELAAVTTSLTWFHAAGDRNCPASAAQRLVGRLPDARLVEWPEDGGHLYGYHHEPDLLDELLAR